MLQELAVENLLLIERAQLRFAAGLNMITGETGAGKSVLAHALDLLLGGRARGGIVRPGAAEAYVEGIFDLPRQLRGALRERLPTDAQEIVLARRVGADGRTRAYINGRSAPVGELREAGETLLSFYGQHEHRRLTVAAAQLTLLDELCGEEQALSLRACAETHARVRALAGRLESLREMAASRERELALLEHELAEIDALAVQEGEYERLLASRERLRRAEALGQAAGAAEQALAADSDEVPGALARLAPALAGLQALAGSDATLDTLARRLSSLVIEGQDVAGELCAYGEALAAEACAGEAEGGGGAGALEAVEQRLAEIERLVRKHGGSVQAIAEHAAGARARRAELSGAERELAQADEELERARAQLAEHAASLRKRRRAMAPALGEAVRERLAGLAMSEASFEVLLSEREMGPSGADAVEFRISPNPGVPAGPVREIASGGELSRIMLALNTACLGQTGSAPTAVRGCGRAGKSAGAEPQPTLAFDELDAGIGGHTARAVGAQLRELARERQLLCITHLPQIASLAQRHFAIVKDTSATPTKTTVVELGEGQVLSELVRMLGADADDSAARRHARELRKAA